MTMDFRDLPFTLRQVQYAVAVHRLDGFGRAATACGVSQPSLSAQIARLEELLGVQLFERHARSVRPTAAGARILPLFERLLGAAAEVEARARELADPGRIVLRIGVIPTVAPYLLPAAVDALRAQHPDVRVHWIEAITASVEDRLQEGDLDVGLIADPPSRPGMEHAELLTDPFSWVVPRDSPLEGPLGARDLAGRDVMLLEDGHCLRDHALDVCLRDGVQESPYRATSLGTLVQMVAGGMGLTVLPRSALAVETRRAAVRVLPFPGRAPGRVLRLVWRTRSPHAERMPALAATLREAFGASGAP